LFNICIFKYAGKKNYQLLFEKYNLAPVFLITPKTEKNRILKIADLCENSFIYLVSDNEPTY